MTLPLPGMPPMGDFRVLVTGWRYWPKDAAWVIDDALFRVYNTLFKRSGAAQMVVVEGQCPYGGADEHAYDWVQRAVGHGRTDVRSERHPAEVTPEGRVRGAERNARMVQRGARVCLAFPGDSYLRQRGGTFDCAMKALAAQIPVWTFHWSPAYTTL